MTLKPRVLAFCLKRESAARLLTDDPNEHFGRGRGMPEHLALLLIGRAAVTATQVMALLIHSKSCNH